MALRPRDVFAGFTVVRLLGSGGMGEVYLAQHPGCHAVRIVTIPAPPSRPGK